MIEVKDAVFLVRSVYIDVVSSILSYPTVVITSIQVYSEMKSNFGFVLM